MSAYIVDDNTINAIVKAFENYGVEYKAENFKSTNPFGVNFIVDVDSLRHDIGQSLLDQNYASVNYRYSEEDATPEYKFEDVYINEGLVKSCMDCYIYQACETEDFFKSELYKSLLRLKDKILDRLIAAQGFEGADCWGYEDYLRQRGAFTMTEA